MTIKQLQKYNKILILGYGMEGKATHSFIKKQIPGSTITVADSKKDSNYLEKQTDYDLVIKTPGIPKSLVTQKYTTATNIFFANVRGVTIGVTGTKGKSTTASLIYAILKKNGMKAHLVGNIGNSMLAELELSNTKDDYFVCELSSYQLDDCNFSPHIAVILNLFPDHMTYHKLVENYYDAKTRIIKYASKNDFYVYNPKYKQLTTLASHTKATSVPFVKNIDLDLRNSTLIGDHNKENIGAALAVAQILGISLSRAQSTIGTFKTLPHRLQKVGEFKQIIYYDDGASVTPQSTIASLLALQKVDTLLLGGQDRGYDFTDLVDAICKTDIRNIVLFPETGEKIKKMLNLKKPHYFNFLLTKSMHEAVQFAFDHTKPGTIALLSSASPSYSLWVNFSEKGDEYQRIIKELGK